MCGGRRRCGRQDLLADLLHDEFVPRGIHTHGVSADLTGNVIFERTGGIDSCCLPYALQCGTSALKGKWHALAEFCWSSLTVIQCIVLLLYVDLRHNIKQRGGLAYTK